jgi:uncharacterized protein (DUF1330 family)
MSALFIVFIEPPADPSEISEYRRLALPSLTGKDVKFLTVPDGTVSTLEGETVDAVVVMEFASRQEAADWYHGPVYQNAVKHRLGTAKSRAVIVDKP